MFVTLHNAWLHGTIEHMTIIVIALLGWIALSLPAAVVVGRAVGRPGLAVVPAHEAPGASTSLSLPNVAYYNPRPAALPGRGYRKASLSTAARRRFNDPFRPSLR